MIENPYHTTSNNFFYSPRLLNHTKTKTQTNLQNLLKVTKNEFGKQGEKRQISQKMSEIKINEKKFISETIKNFSESRPRETKTSMLAKDRLEKLQEKNKLLNTLSAKVKNLEDSSIDEI